jgi:tRNA threonylcarbamoyladenosine biosynthesis protein TsaB
LLSRIESLLKDRGSVWSDLTGLIICAGPGSFTSLRIGHTVMNTLADSLGIGIVSKSGDDWLAQAVEALSTAEVGRPVMPIYGGEAHVTRPKA